MPKALITDVDGTITDAQRRIDTGAILAMRILVDAGIPVVLASGNTVCSMNILSKMIGTDGTIIAENGGVYRVKYEGKEVVLGNQAACQDAFVRIEECYASQGIELELYSPEYRFADVAFARNVHVEDVRRIVADLPVRILDTGFAIHIQSPGLSKGEAFRNVAEEMDISPSDFLAIGDSENDIEMIQAAGCGAAVANSPATTSAAAGYVSTKEYGNGFIEIVKNTFSLLF